MSIQKDVISMAQNWLMPHITVIMLFTLQMYMFAGMSSASAASYDCAKANSRIEKRICADKVLSNKDEHLSKVYIEALATSNRDGQDSRLNTILRISQRVWLHLRDGCPDNECLNLAYDLRIAEINNYLRAPKGSLLASNPKDRIVLPSAALGLTGAFPPYPDVWGVEVPKQIASVYEVTNGDFLIIYPLKDLAPDDKKLSGCSLSQNWMGVTFFTSVKICLTDSQTNFLGNRYRRIRLSIGRKHYFKDGSSVEPIDFGYSGCYSNFTHSLVLRDPSGHEVARKSVLMLLASAQTIKLRQKLACGTDVNFVQSVAPMTLGQIHVLPERGILLVHDRHVLLVDRNLETKVSLSGMKVFIVDWQKIKEIEKSVLKTLDTENYFQSYDDAIRDHLQRLTSERKSL